MRVAAVAASLLAGLLAGCAQPADEGNPAWTEDWRILVDGEHYEFLVPLWRAPDDTGGEHMAQRAAAALPIRGDATVRPALEAEPPGLLVQGDGPADIEAHVAFCCGDGFVDAAWPADGTLPLKIRQGTLSDVHVRVEANGPSCWREAAYGHLATTTAPDTARPPGADQQGCI